MAAPATVSVSIIIPVRNEAQHIGPLLEFATAAELPKREILVIDGRSDDGTRDIVVEHQRKDPRIRLLDNPRRIVTTAVNIGFAEARGDVIMRLDAHAEYAPDYIDRCLEVLEETDAGNGGLGVVATASGVTADAYFDDVQYVTGRPLCVRPRW
jgi:glycosyltransferase involved in cell wall biosynthesis